MNMPSSLRDIEHWLTQSTGRPPAEEIQVIRRHLHALVASPPQATARERVMEGLHMRTLATVDALIPKLYNVRLPISTNTRQTVRSMQDALECLASLELEVAEYSGAGKAGEIGQPIDLLIWRILETLSRALSLANLIAAPANSGTWHGLHRAYLVARRYRIEHHRPVNLPIDLQTLYARTLIAGSIPPSALNANEWAFLHRFLSTTRSALEVIDSTTGSEPETTLWVSPEQDTPPTQLERRPPAPGTLAIFIECSSILREIRDALSTLVQGHLRPAFLPEDTSPRTARIALRRLREHLSSPRTRRFPRRRQGYRATLCIGFDEICRLLRTEIESDEVLSEWMIVNESPGGYAAMHVAGRQSKAQVGDLVAIRRDDSTKWSISIVRWALSENPEHLEFGLEEVSPQALSGRMTTPGLPAESHPRALFLPAMPPIRASDALAFSPEFRPVREQTHAFLFDRAEAGKIDFRIGNPIEQSSSIDICLISTAA